MIFRRPFLASQDGSGLFIDNRKVIVQMKHTPKILPKSVILFSFFVGVLCAISFRSLTILAKVRPEWVRPVWYFAVVGYVYFFAYRFYITHKRKKVIIEQGLLEKLEQHDNLTEEDRAVISYLLASLIKSKEGINYLLIFVLSIVAIVIDVMIQ